MVSFKRVKINYAFLGAKREKEIETETRWCSRVPQVIHEYNIRSRNLHIHIPIIQFLIRGLKLWTDFISFSLNFDHSTLTYGTLLYNCAGPILRLSNQTTFFPASQIRSMKSSLSVPMLSEINSVGSQFVREIPGADEISHLLLLFNKYESER